MSMYSCKVKIIKFNDWISTLQDFYFKGDFNLSLTLAVILYLNSKNLFSTKSSKYTQSIIP